MAGKLLRSKPPTRLDEDQANTSERHLMSQKAKTTTVSGKSIAKTTHDKTTAFEARPFEHTPISGNEEAAQPGGNSAAPSQQGAGNRYPASRSCMRGGRPLRLPMEIYLGRS